MGNHLSFVQFVHPGQEHVPDEGNHVNWNRGPVHKRKFLKQKGVYIDSDDNKINDDIVFWGEWEPQSRVLKKMDSYLNGMPSFIYGPYYDLGNIGNDRENSGGSCAGGGWQNTDPFVFGNHFYYGICRQVKRQSLRELDKGSVIIFGSCKKNIRNEWEYIVDTIFVVRDFIDYDPNDLKELKQGGNISKEYLDVSLLPYSKTDDANKGVKHRIYISATHQEPYKGMYSYFPCKKYTEDEKGFRRPDIYIDGIISKSNLRSFKVIKCETVEEVKSLWDNVKRQIIGANLMLGVRAEMPQKEG